MLFEGTSADIRGVGIYESMKYDGASVSFGGNSHLMFATSDMNDDPFLNSVKFKTDELSSTEVKLVGTGLTCKNKLLLFSNMTLI